MKNIFNFSIIFFILSVRILGFSATPSLFQNTLNTGNELEIITWLYGEGMRDYAQIGYSLAGVGDINQDGYDDVLVGIPHRGPGEVWLLFGGAEMDSIPDMIFRGEHERDGFGTTVAAGGDINGDGAPDILISAPSYPAYGTAPPPHGVGRMYLFYGGDVLDSIPDWNFDGDRQYASFGLKITTGDVDGDIYNDILTSTVNFGPHVRGKACLFSGSQSLDPVLIWSNTGDTEKTYLGSGVAIGDLNADGESDILINSTINGDYTQTEIFLNHSTVDTIASYCIIDTSYGDFVENLLFCADFNQDGYTDFFTRYYGYKIFYGGPDFDMVPDAGIMHRSIVAPRYFVCAGDINGDRYPEVLCGAPNFQFISGSVQLFLGSQNIDRDPDWMAGGRGLTGYCVAAAGDVNGDG